MSLLTLLCDCRAYVADLEKPFTAPCPTYSPFLPILKPP
jgi:hypothetical protein